MKYYNEENQLVIKSWCNEPEEGCIEQARNLARLPFVFKQICLMPDTHCGYGMPIGGVMGTIGAVVPNAVGVDIGCGMISVKTSLTEIELPLLKKILGEIRKQIPVGFSHQSCAQSEDLMPMNQLATIGMGHEIICQEFLSARKQLGTLGGGNHFIEIQKGNDGHIWIMIHSGSRNLGKKVADYYNKLAIELNEKYHSKVPKEWQLAFLPLDSDEAQNYLADMNYCVEFALANRKLMMNRICNIFQEYGDSVFIYSMINIAHNYARIENHFGKNVLVHRKGATSARLDEVGIIPGSQGTASYIVRGLGNEESFMSCSHGAGRKMGRKEAQRNLNLRDEKKKLDDLGILHAIRGKDDLDEASGAYKDIDIVMEEQKDLVEKIVELKPLAVIKG
jgi:tRNA-splicing ligase RtcB